MQWLTEAVGSDAQTPAPLPSASDLAALDPAVAITLLVASVVIALLFYVGPSLRDRLRPPTPPAPPAAPAAPPATATATSPALPPAAPTAVDQAETRTAQFIDHLLRQIQDGAEREDELEERLRAKELEHDARIRAKDELITQREQEIRRLETLLWQRGHPR